MMAMARRLPQMTLILAAAIMGSVVLLAAMAPVIAPFSPTDGSLQNALTPPAWLGGDVGNLLGTDAFGRDILSRMIHGARVSLVTVTISIVFGGGIGIALGLISGYFGGWIDVVLMRITDIALSIPLILMALVLAVALGPSLQNVIIVLAVLLWPRYARQARGETLAIREREFVALARVAGCSSASIVRKHILPHVMPSLLVLGTLQIGFVISLEATLSFLGAGIPPPQPSWGLMVADGRSLLGTAWWVSLFPGAAILLAVLSANVLGDWIRDRFDPKLSQV